MIRIMTPIIPFMTEHIWQNMVREVEKDESECIMLSGYPTKIYDTSFEDNLKNVEIARDIMSTAQRLRNENQIKVKQPLKKLYVAGDNEIKKAVDSLEDIIKDELNIKEIEVVKDDSKFNDEYLSVNFKKAGAVLKGDVQKLKNTLQVLTDEEIAKAVKGFKVGKVDVGEFKGLSEELFNLEKKPKKDFVIAHENGKTVVLDITLDEGLIEEGLYREFVRSLQVLRKEADFSIDDRIKASFKTDNIDLQNMIKKFNAKIKQEVLISEIKNDLDKCDIAKDIEVGDGFVTVKLSK